MIFKLMKRFTVLFLLVIVIVCGAFFSRCNTAQDPKSNETKNKNTEILLDNNLGIIPKPVSFSLTKKEDFNLQKGVVITPNKNLEDEILYLNNLLNLELNISSEIGESSEIENQIFMEVDEELPSESYQIDCQKNRISIVGGSREAVFYGIQTIRQVLSVNTGVSELRVIPSFSLKDSPKFKWRGMLLDVCRHYFPKEVVKKYINLLAFYKMNVLHWHITEDQAWRIAIDAYPKLTETGAWREDPNSENGELYGGFYSKEDIKEIVKYASERHIQIIPEIEMPGHSSAAVASYPELGCTGEQISIPNDWGVFKDIYCPTENTFEFLETVLSEVMELFPSDYVHIGGDEAPKTRWEESEFCQNLMKTEGLDDYEELQSYFINRMAKFLEENGKTIIGWDEILNDELTETAIIQSWRGMDGGKKAVSEGRNAIMSPTSHCYLDYSLKAIDTEKIYGFDPIPPDCNAEEAARIMGAECNMWTEHVPDENTLDSKVFPRLIAAAESFWGTNNDFEGFVKRLDRHYPVLEKMGVNYGNETVAISVNTQTEKDKITVQLEENLRNPKTTYTLLNSQYPLDTLYEFQGEKIIIGQDGISTLNVSSGKVKTPNPELLTLNFNKHNWLTAKVKYSVPFSDYYTAGGEDGLTDGVLGSLDFRDGHWQGFFGDDVELIIENSNENKEISSVSMNFYRYINSWIFPPESVRVSYSSDGVEYTELDSYYYSEEEMHARGKQVLSPSFSFSPVKASYLKINIKNIGEVPHWHEASSEPAWVFLDEVVVK